jgi:hypothetical protein
MATLVSAAAGVSDIEDDMGAQRLMEIPCQKGVPGNLASSKRVILEARHSNPDGPRRTAAASIRSANYLRYCVPPRVREAELRPTF